MRIGIDMGGTSIKIGLVDYKNRIVEKLVLPTRVDVPPEDMVRDMIQIIYRLMKMGNLTFEQCKGIGIGSPGTIDYRNGVILYSNNLGWERVPIVKWLTREFPLSVLLTNDADAAALGEVYAGAARGVKNAVLLTLGTGVGSGVIQNGEIFYGSLHGGVELGHMVIRADGEPCTCGRRGCLEAYASATALVRMAKKAAEGNPKSIMHRLCDNRLECMNGEIPFRAAELGDEAAKGVVEEYEHNLAEGIANVINIFRPEIVILGGGVAAQKEKLTKPLEHMVKELCFAGAHGEVAPIVTSCLGNDAGIIGAATLLHGWLLPT